LVRGEVKEIIEANSQHPDLSICWYIPGTVIDERRYQMRKKAFELFPSIEKLEKLLGHKLNITKEILIHRVDEAIENQLHELGISPLHLDISEIDWEALINRAIYRHPPFDPGGKEKGFRDSLIAEAFLQLVQKSPVTPTTCRLAIITNDGLLADYVRESAGNSKNIRVLSNISELESLINTLVSQVTEDFVAEVSKKASKYFFEKEDKSTLYYKENVKPKVRELYKEELDRVPREGLTRENGTWWISDPVFVKKEVRRIFWVTPIKVDAELFEYETPQVVATSGASSSWPFIDLDVGKGSLLSTVLSSPPRTRKKVDTGQSEFGIHWSANYTQRKKFTSPRIDEIEFVSTKWDKE